MKMKKQNKWMFVAGLCAISLLFSVSCGKTDDSSSSKAESSTSSSQGLGGLWETATYTEDTEVGTGSTTIQVEVKAEDNSITFTVHTDADNLGTALTENDLVSGDDSEYGLYIKEVDGIRADYDKDQAYWAISKDGEYLQTGADSTEIADGEHYELTYTEG